LNNIFDDNLVSEKCIKAHSYKAIILVFVGLYELHSFKYFMPHSYKWPMKFDGIFYFIGVRCRSDFKFYRIVLRNYLFSRLCIGIVISKYTIEIDFMISQISF